MNRDPSIKQNFYHDIMQMVEVNQPAAEVLTKMGEARGSDVYDRLCFLDARLGYLDVINQIANDTVELRASAPDFMEVTLSDVDNFATHTKRTIEATESYANIPEHVTGSDDFVDSNIGQHLSSQDGYALIRTLLGDRFDGHSFENMQVASYSTVTAVMESLHEILSKSELLKYVLQDDNQDAETELRVFCAETVEKEFNIIEDELAMALDGLSTLHDEEQER